MKEINIDILLEYWKLTVSYCSKTSFISYNTEKFLL